MAEKDIIEQWILNVGIGMAILAVGIGLLVYWQKKNYEAYRSEVYSRLLATGNAQYYSPHIAKNCWLNGFAPSVAAIKMAEYYKSSDGSL